MICPLCGGDGKEDGYYPYMTYIDRKCGFCHGKGWISITQYMQYVRDHKGGIEQ